MRKIPTLFVRDFSARPAYVTDEVTPGCEWVLASEGVATRKYDGTCVMLDEHGEWWARREVKEGKPRPSGFVEADHDETTGKTVGWGPIKASSWARWHQDALESSDPEDGPYVPGTYELCGPKINGNPERYPWHVLILHANAERFVTEPPRDYAGLYVWIGDFKGGGMFEGIVFHHPDGRMAKIKKRDFPS